jgi:hypothetical protein
MKRRKKKMLRAQACEGMLSHRLTSKKKNRWSAWKSR